MEKFKDFFNISDRDKQMLLVLAAILIVVCAYFFGFNNLNETCTTLENQKNTLAKTEKDLKEKTANKNKYIQDTNTYDQITREILADYDTGSTEPSQIDFLNKIETTTNTWLQSVSFATPVSVYTFGIKASSNPNNSGLAYASDMRGYKTTLSMAFEASYDELKSFVKYVNSYYSKNTIDNISMVYNEGTDKISGTVDVSTYAITGSDRSFTEPKFSVTLGKSNVFSSLSTTTSTKTK